MTGTILNTITILVGGLLGLRFGKLLPNKTRETIVIGLGLFTIGLALNMFLETNNSLIVLGGILLGGILGENLQIEDRINKLGERLESRFNGKSPSDSTKGNFVRGFMTSSILFCTGPMAILGAIQDGLIGDFQLLAIKSVIDGVAAFALASTLGIGVIFSGVMVFLYQGFFSLFIKKQPSLSFDHSFQGTTSAVCYHRCPASLGFNWQNTKVFLCGKHKCLRVL